MPDDIPKHTFHGFTELPVGFHERAFEAKLAHAAITSPVEIESIGETSVAAAELHIVPDDKVKRDKLTAKADPAAPAPVKPAPVVVVDKKEGA